VIDLMATKLVTVERRTGDIYVNGHLKPGATTVVANVKANVQPLTGAEILQLPEGDRIRQHKWAFARYEFKVNDIITYKGIKFEVQMVEDWSDFCIAHYRARMVKVNEQFQAR